MNKFLGYLVDFMTVALLASSPMAFYNCLIGGDYFGAVCMACYFCFGVDRLSQGWRTDIYREVGK